MSLFTPHIDDSLPSCLSVSPRDPFDPFSCGKPFPNCTNAELFQFTSLKNITLLIQNACPTDERLVAHPLAANESALAPGACEIFAGSGPTEYPGADIWTRLTTWKFPLLQLVSQFPRPPLGFRIEALVLARLLGDPIATFRHLVLKIDNCQRRADFWKREFADGGSCEICVTEAVGGSSSASDWPLASFKVFERCWKSFALVVDSADEWGREEGDAWQKILCWELSREDANPRARARLVERCLEAADALAADRTTRFLPVAVAMAFFIGSVGIAFFRTADSGSPSPLASPTAAPTLYINIEAYSIAFTAPFFFLISTITVAALIGTSQTECAIPRILQSVRMVLQRPSPRAVSEDPALEEAWRLFTAGDCDRPDYDDDERRLERRKQGGIYSCQQLGSEGRAITLVPFSRSALADAWEQTSHAWRASKSWHQKCFEIVRLAAVFSWTLLRSTCRIEPRSELLSTWNVFVGCLAGWLIAMLVPPDGWGCRSYSIFAIFVWWTLSRVLDLPLDMALKRNYKVLATLHWLKDSLMAIGVFVMVILTQFGLFNKCACYTGFGKHGLVLPEDDVVAALLNDRIRLLYPALAASCIAYQLIVIPGLIMLQYRGAMQVFLQRDDGQSNIAAFQGWRFGRMHGQSWTWLWRTMIGRSSAPSQSTSRISRRSISASSLLSPARPSSSQARVDKGVMLAAERSISPSSSCG